MVRVRLLTMRTITRRTRTTSLHGSHGLSARRAQRTKSSRSWGPSSLLKFVHLLRGSVLISTFGTRFGERPFYLTNVGDLNTGWGSTWGNTDLATIHPQGLCWADCGSRSIWSHLLFVNSVHQFLHPRLATLQTIKYLFSYNNLRSSMILLAGNAWQ